MGLQDVISSTYSALTSQPKAVGNPASLKAPTFTPVIKQTFQTTFTTFLDDAATGQYDNQEIAKKQQELEVRIKDRIKSGGGPAATVDVSGGGPTSSGANAAPTTQAGGNDQELAKLRKQQLAYAKDQAEWRLSRISESLTARMAAGAAMPSLFGGKIDPMRYQPKTEAEAKGFAQRLTIDLAEGAARLELIQTQYDIAVDEMKEKPNDDARRRRVVELADSVRTQRASVDHLIQAYEQRISDKGEANLLAGANDDPGTNDELKTIQKAVKEEAETGDSATFDKLSEQIFGLAMNFLKMQEDMQKNDLEDYARYREEQKQIDKISARKAAFEQGIARSSARNAEFEASLKKRTS